MARDKYHQEFRYALENSGWLVTADPLHMTIDTIIINIDLEAEHIIGAEKDGEKIAIEIKTFSLGSFITAFYEAVGKYIVYREALFLKELDRTLYLAIPDNIYKRYGHLRLVKRVLDVEQIKLVIYEPQSQIITQWIK